MADTVVVGASVAGLFAAEHLARAGQRVVVLERQKEVGSLQRTWIVTSQIAELLGEVPQDSVVHQTDIMDLRAGPAHASVPLDPPDLIIERSLLIPYLAERARSVGVEIVLNSDVERIDATAGRIRLGIRSRNGRSGFDVRARNLVGADGAHSMVGRTFGASVPRLIPVLQANVELPDQYDSRVTRVWFDRSCTRFFFWLIPHSDLTGVAGLVADSSREAREDLDGFLRLQGFRTSHYQGALIPLHSPFRRISWRIGRNRVLLVGDAAAHVKVTTVGGVVSGLWGAQAAARALHKGSSYRTELRGLHGELHLHDLLRWSLDRFRQSQYEDLLDSMNAPLVELLGHRNRDSMRGAELKLLLAQPRVFALGLRALFRPNRQWIGTEREYRSSSPRPVPRPDSGE